MLVIIFQNFTTFQCRSDSPQVKQNLISGIANLVYELPSKLPNDLTLMIIENQEVLEKSQVMVDTQPATQYHFKNLDFGKSRYKTFRNRYKIFIFLSTFTGFLHFFPNIQPRLSEQLNFCLNSAQLPWKFSFFHIFYDFKVYLRSSMKR